MSSQMYKHYHYETHIIEYWCSVYNWRDMIQTIVQTHLCIYVYLTFS
jgi:hypothetical protein